MYSKIIQSGKSVHIRPGRYLPNSVLVPRSLSLSTFHALAHHMITGWAIREWQTVYLMRRFDLGFRLKSIKQHQVTDMVEGPMCLQELLQS